MELWKAAVLGIVQGLTEFLPVSSSAHVLLFERLLGVNTGGDLFFGVMLHAGTLCSLLIACRERIVSLFCSERKKLLYLLLATLPAALAGVFLGDLVERLFFGGAFLPYAFIATGVLLLFCGKVKRTPRLLNAPRALGVGFSQALAVIPGLSRSGTTYAAGVFLGLSREEAADFSFLLAIPIVGGALLFELIKAGRSAAMPVGWAPLFTGACCAAVSGLVALAILRPLFSKGKLWGFSVYLFVLAAVLFFVPLA